VAAQAAAGAPGRFARTLLRFHNANLLAFFLFLFSLLHRLAILQPVKLATAKAPQPNSSRY
jgi:hypothetical protein